MSDRTYPPDRILLGPGPSDVHPAVLRAMAAPLLGHLDPDFTPLLDEIAERLRVVFGTRNRVTFPVSGTGSAGLEAAIVNLVEPGDDVVVGVNGVFGGRLAEVARRAGGKVHTVEAPWGRIIEPEAFLDACRGRGARVAALVGAETSTGVHQPVAEIAGALRDTDTLLVLDTVTALAGVEVEVDRWGVDVAYAGTQKCLSVPPGLAPITFSDRAVERIRARRTPVQSWYLDVTLLLGYLDAAGGRTYHHTAPISMLYGLHAGLGLVLEEGLDARIARHARLGGMLQDGLEALGLPLLAQEGHRLPQLTTVGLPEGVDEAVWRRRLLDEHGVEVGGGLGELAGRAWRIGLMGHSCQERNVLLVLAALERLLAGG
jgi:alanine-glyoxylate transaminase / serine-glyoxylate transaminase / serine-pyruvate transaminase